MSKRVEIDGAYYRKRRGKLVRIPDEWVGKTVDRQTIRKRGRDRREDMQMDRNYGVGRDYKMRPFWRTRSPLDDEPTESKRKANGRSGRRGPR